VPDRAEGLEMGPATGLSEWWAWQVEKGARGKAGALPVEDGIREAVAVSLRAGEACRRGQSEFGAEAMHGSRVRRSLAIL